MSLQVQATCELRLHRDHFEFAIRDFLGQAQCMDIIGLGEGEKAEEPQEQPAKASPK